MSALLNNISFYFRRLVMPGIIILMSGCVPSENRGNGIPESAIQDLLTGKAEEADFSGTVAISQNGLKVFEQAYGIADRSWEIPMQTDHRFDIASVNKSMVGGLIMIAVEEGRISLTDRLTDLLTDFSYSGTFHEEITIHHMLTHTSGLPDYDAVGQEYAADGFRKLKRMHFTNEAYIDFISQIDAVGKPGEQFRYSNFAYHLLSLILEELYQMSFGDLIKEKIFRPLSMEQSYSTTDNLEVQSKLVTGYVFEDGEWRENPYIDLTIGRRVFSTSSNLLKWANAFNESGLFTKESLEILKTNHLKSINSRFSYAYGWVVVGAGEEFAMGDLGTDKPYLIHGGSTDGYKSLLVNVNDGEWVVSILSNSGNRTNELEMGREITQLLLKNTQ